MHDRIICVVQKNNSNIANNVVKYQRSGKAGKAVPYVFEVPEQIFHFVSKITPYDYREGNILQSASIRKFPYNKSFHLTFYRNYKLKEKSIINYIG